MFLWLFSLYFSLSLSLSRCPSSFLLFHPPPIWYPPTFILLLKNKSICQSFHNSRSHISAYLTLTVVETIACDFVLLHSSAPNIELLRWRVKSPEVRRNEEGMRPKSRAKPKLDIHRPGARVPSGRAVLPILFHRLWETADHFMSTQKNPFTKLTQDRFYCRTADRVCRHNSVETKKESAG